jgi:hypothetical protein
MGASLQVPFLMIAPLVWQNFPECLAIRPLLAYPFIKKDEVKEMTAWQTLDG